MNRLQFSQAQQRTFIIAEAGVNHNGSLSIAKQLIDVALEAGADAVKFQLFQTEQLVCKQAPKAIYQKKHDPAASQYEMLKSLELNAENHAELNRYCHERGILFLSSPFDRQCADFLLHSLNMPIMKIPSGEITHFPLLLKIAQTGKPVILSTGMSTLGDIEAALTVLASGYLSSEENFGEDGEIYYSAKAQAILQEKVALLHCTSEYPAPSSEANLRVLQTLQQAFGLAIGYSDHTLGISVAIAAVALGARIIEKHFTLDKSLLGPDHSASLSPAELKAMIAGIREVESALGIQQKLPTRSELKNRLIARKSLVALAPISKGELFTEFNLGCKRPGNGISPKYYYQFINKRAERDYEIDELIGV